MLAPLCRAISTAISASFLVIGVAVATLQRMIGVFAPLSSMCRNMSIGACEGCGILT